MSTHYPLMLPSTSPREALLAGPFSPPWNLSSFTVESILSFPCSCSDPLFLATVLAHIMTCCSGQMTFFLFILARAAMVYLPTALSVALRPPLFPYQQVQYAQAFSLKPAPLRKLFASLGSTNKSATSLPLSYLTLVLSSPP